MTPEQAKAFIADFTPFEIDSHTVNITNGAGDTVGVEKTWAIVDCNGMALLGINGEPTEFDQAAVALLNAAGKSK